MKIKIEIEAETNQRAITLLNMLIKTLEMANSLSLPFDHLEITDDTSSIKATGGNA